MAQVEQLATAKERNRVAREIHDTLDHALMVINVQLEAAQHLLATNPPATGGAPATGAPLVYGGTARALDALQKAHTTAQQGLADVRRSVAALRAPPEQQRPLAEALSERELEVLRLVDGGASNKEIAAQLFLAEGTVKNHVTNILGKLGTGSRMQAVNRGRELGIIP